MEKNMHASTHTIDLHEVSGVAPSCARENRRRPGAVTAAAGPGFDLGGDIRARSRRAKRVHLRFAYGVEHVLFAVILAATGYLYLGVFLKQAL
jgi:hypothetical protein